MLKFIQKNLLILIILVIAAGLLNVKFFGGYKFTPLICLWAALLMIYPSLVPLSFDKIKEVKKYWRILLFSVVLNFILAPAVAYFIGWLFLSEQPALRLGIILLALLPGGGMVTMWALKSRANMLITVGIVLLNLLLAIVIVPFGLSYVMNQLQINKTTHLQQSVLNKDLRNINSVSLDNDSKFVSLNDNAESTESCVIEKVSRGSASCGLGGEGVTPMKIAIPIIFIILFPLILAFATQKILLKRKSTNDIIKIKKSFGAFSNLGLLIILFMLMSLKDNIVIFDRAILIWDIFVALLFFYGIIFFVSWFIYKKFYFNSQGKALLWGSYLRYITLALGLAISLVYQDKSLEPIILIIVLSYLIQIPSSYLIANLLKNR
jgi:ACR3 family arsenite efflux pump ArsB